MHAPVLRELLKIDWAELENTPVRERQSAKLARWHLRARRLARLEGRPYSTVSEELKHAAAALASRQRRDQLNELARDLAVSRALGRNPTPPWRRRLRRLAELSRRSDDELRRQVEGLAARVRVVFQETSETP